MKRLWIVVVAGLCLAIVYFVLHSAQDSRLRGQQEAKPTEPAIPPVEAFRMQVGDLMQQGKTNEIIRLLDSALTREDLKPVRGVILRELLFLLIGAGDLQKAQEKFLAVAVSEDKRFARDAAGVIEHSLHANGRHADLAEWCEKLLGQNVEDPLKVASAIRLVQACLDDGKADKALEILSGLPGRLSAANTKPVVDGVLENLFGAQRYADVEKLLGQVEKDPLKAVPGLAGTAAGYRVRLLVQASKVEDAGKMLMQSLDVLGDSAAGGLLGQVGDLARREKNLKCADALCLQALGLEKAGPALLRAASEQAIAVARDMNDPEMAFARLRLAAGRVADAATQFHLVRQVSYFIMEKGKKETLRQTRDLCEQLTEKAQAERDRAEGNSLLLDIYFMTEDFDKALKVVESDKTETEKDMRDMLLVKIRAHQALAAGNKRDAVTLFEQFLETIKKMDEPRVSAEDPITKLRVSKEEVLALNAARIGKLWSEVGEKEKAAAALQEAKAGYEKALARAAAGSPERQAIEQALKDLAK